MVIKSKIYDFLKKNLGEYLYGFQKNQLDVGLLSGHIDLVNVNFRPDKVNQLLGSLGLPITIKAGLMGKLRLKCHYTSFLTSPIELEIDELLLIFGPITHIARENKNLFEDNLEEALLQAKLQQKIINSNKKKHRTQSNKGETLFNEATPKVNRKINKVPSFKSEHRSGNKGVFEDKTGDKKSFDISEKMMKNEGLDKTVIKNDVENNKKKNKCENGKEIKKHEKNEGSTIVIQGIENNDDFKCKQRGKKDENFEAYSERVPQTHDNYVEDVKKKEGILEKYFSKILKNLILTVKSVHIRYEDETYPYQNPFSIGFSLTKLEVKNISHEWVYSDSKPTKRSPRKNAIVKDISFTNFAMYIYSMASVLIPTSLWEATIHSEIGIFEAFPAYEVRDLILQESTTLSKSHPSTFIEPTNISMCISFYQEAPTLRIAGFIEKVQIKFTASMAECVRDFFEYCTNVQIWPLVLRFRPFVRIPERPEKRERRKERKRRREIVKLWFLYAFAFIKTKRAAIRYVKDRKSDKETMINLERQEKIREKVMMGMQNSTNKKDHEGVGNGEKQKSSFFSFGKKKIPGLSGTGLSDLVKDYNSKKTINQPLKRRPYDGEIYFPKSMTNSETELNIKTLFLSIADEDTDLSLEIEAHDIYFISNTLVDEMNSVLSIRSYVVGILDQSKRFEMVKAGNSAYQNDVKNHNFKDQYAVKMTKVYRPGEVLIPNDVFLSMNMYEVNTVLSPITITYTHNTITQLFLIKEAIELDKCYREHLDIKYIKNFNQHCKKLKIPKIIGVDFKKYVLCKQVAKKFIMMQKEADTFIKELHENIVNIMFDVNFEVQGGVVNCYDFSPNAIMSINLARNKFTFAKDKEFIYASALGFLLQSSSAPMPLYEFVTSVGSLCLEKIKLMDGFCRYKK